MKILFVSLKMNLGGTEKALLALMNVLHKKPVKITLLLLEKGGVLESQIPDFVEVKYIRDFAKMKPIIENPPHFTLLNLIRSFHLLQAFSFLITYAKIKISGNWYYHYKAVLKKTAQFGTYDVAVAFAGPSDFISYFVIHKVTARKKIQWIHFDIEKVISNFNFGEKCYPFFDQIFCVSNSAKEIFLTHFPNLKNRTSVFHNIVSASEIVKLAEEDLSFNDGYSGLRILTVGRFTPEKGQHLIPEVVAKLKQEKLDLRWYFVGDGKEKATIQKITADLGLSENIIFLGERENPYPYMKDCDLYVQPSVHEGFGITVEEAKVFNKPIVITRFASATDLIEDQKTGFIVDISVEGIYKALKILISRADLRNKFSENLQKKKPVINIEIEKLFE